MDQSIRNFIKKFNKGWTTSKLEKVAELLDDDVVFVAPDLKTEIKGRVKCLQTFKDYLNVAQTQKFEVRDKKMHTWKGTAAITLEYYIEYILNDQEYHELGTEIWLLIKVNDSWKMAWRAVVKNEAMLDTT